MVRNGFYCIYQGKEYYLTSDMQGNTIIYAEDPDLADETFTFSRTMYKKIIDPEEIQEAYLIETKAIINGDELDILNAPGGEKDMYWVEAYSKELIKKYNMKEIDRGVYGTWMHKNKIQVLERKTNADHYFKKPKDS